jgi:release factor glutamine methyltransferase
MGVSPAQLISRGNQPISADTAARLDEAIRRHLAGEPVHRIAGKREFYGLSLALSQETLEPRPDTEALVDAVLPHLAEIANRKGHAHVLDLGTGTGAICLALLSECAGATGIGSDVSADALATAARNAAANGLAGRFQAVESNWFAAIDGLFDLIVSNPPYIRSDEIADLDVAVRLYDPLRALDGGPDGLDPYRTIAAQAHRHLEAGGIVAVEFGWNQMQDVKAIFEAAGFTVLREVKDLAGHDRVLVLASPR